MLGDLDGPVEHLVGRHDVVHGADLKCLSRRERLTGQDRQQWVAVHRKHHTFTDKEGDPHSPLLLGFWKVQLWNVYYYIQEARNPVTIAKFAPDLGPDRWERLFFSHGWTGLFLGAAVTGAFIGWWQGVVAMLAHAFLYVFVAAPLINGLGHWRGAQNFENTAYNSRVLAWPAGRACTTTITPSPARRSSACGAPSWILRGWPSVCWRPCVWWRS